MVVKRVGSAAPTVIREQRLGTVTGYDGDAADAVCRSRAGQLPDRERAFSQCGTCPSFAATLQLSLIQDVAVVNHAPAGCGGDFAMFNLYNRYGQTKRGLPLSNAHLLSTHLEEQDAIFGATEKLREAVREAVRRFSPRAVFVTASCVSGIIGEDIEGTISQLEEELGIPIGHVGCEGFRSQVWATGWDAAFDAILRKVVKPPERKRPEVVNVVTFIGDDHFSALLRPLGLEPRFVVPFTKVADLERLAEAGLTAQMCPTLGTLLGAGLERLHGVPEVRSPPPYGLAATDAWLREVAERTGKTAEAEALIAAERAAIAPELDALRVAFRGVRGFVAAGPAHGHAFMGILRDLGIEVLGACMWHHDQRLDHGDPRGDALDAYVQAHGNVRYGVCNKQPFEFVNLIRRLQPDLLVIRHPSLGVWGGKLGIPTAFVDDEHLAIGYRGLLRYGRKLLDWYRNPAIERTLARTAPLPFTRWWLEQPPFSLLGAES
jgi:nitrogenase molybdenum-iron protein alpha chain